MSAIGDTETCSICRDEYANAPDEGIQVLSNCLHKFHSNCLREALRHKAVCPLCNKSQRGPVCDAALFVLSYLVIIAMWIEVLVKCAAIGIVLGTAMFGTCSLITAGSLSPQTEIERAFVRRFGPAFESFPCNVSQISGDDERVCDVMYIMWPEYLRALRYDTKIHPNIVNVFETLHASCAQQTIDYWLPSTVLRLLLRYLTNEAGNLLWRSHAVRCELESIKWARGEPRPHRDYSIYWKDVELICGASDERNIQTPVAKDDWCAQRDYAFPCVPPPDWLKNFFFDDLEKERRSLRDRIVCGVLRDFESLSHRLADNLCPWLERWDSTSCNYCSWYMFVWNVLTRATCE